MTFLHISRSIDYNSNILVGEDKHRSNGEPHHTAFIYQPHIISIFGNRNIRNVCIFLQLHIWCFYTLLCDLAHRYKNRKWSFIRLLQLQSFSLWDLFLCEMFAHSSHKMVSISRYYSINTVFSWNSHHWSPSVSESDLC